MKGRPVEELVYECMFPRPKPTDPQNFHGLLQRHLVPEVRLETAAFYGSLDSQEAQYPGLDYSFPPHQRRLSRFTWHRRMFRAFDALKLTPSEIASLTKWEGTKWAKERFEKEQGIRIRDTTGDCIADWVPPELRITSRHTAAQPAADIFDDGDADGDAEDWDEGDESDIDIGESIGLDLNERLRAAVARREAGDSNTVMDEEWEQWLKEAVEAGNVTFHGPVPIGDGSSRSDAHTPIPQHYVSAVRQGQWQQVPESLHDRVRQIEQHMSNRDALNLSRTSPLDARRDDALDAARSAVSRTRDAPAPPPHTSSLRSRARPLSNLRVVHGTVSRSPMSPISWQPPDISSRIRSSLHLPTPPS